jgi:hypothetical protein
MANAREAELQRDVIEYEGDVAQKQENLKKETFIEYKVIWLDKLEEWQQWELYLRCKYIFTIRCWIKFIIKCWKYIFITTNYTLQLIQD